MNEDIAIRYVLELIDKGSAQLLEKDRSIRKSVGDTTNVMRRQAEQAAGDSRLITTAADHTARAYTRAGSTSLAAGRQQREGAAMGVSAYERLATGAETYERRARTALHQTEGHLRQTHGALRDLARQGLALGATYLGYQSIKGAIDSTVSLAKETNRLTSATGLSTRESSALLAVTTARGLSNSQLEQGLVKLSRAEDAVTKGTEKQRLSLAGLASIAHTFTGHQRVLAEDALHAARGSDAQVHALNALHVSLVNDAAAHRIATAGRQSATLSQAQQYTMTKQQIAAWHEHQAALASGNRVANATFTADSQRQKTAVADALAAAGATNKQSDALHRLGLTQADIRRGANDMHFLLGKVAEGIQNVPKGPQRTDLLATVFGRSAVKLGPVLENMREQVKLANEYGATLDGKTIKSVDQLEQAELRVKYAHQGLQIAFTQDVQPMLLGLEKGAGDVAHAWSQPGLDLNQRMQRTTNALDKLDIGDKIATAIRVGLPIMAKAAVHAAPIIGAAFLTGFAHAGLPGDAIILAWGAKKLGLWGGLGRTAGKAFFAKFLETDIGKRIVERIGLGAGSRGGGGVLSKATGLLGATPETAMWVRMIGTGPIPVPSTSSTVVQDAEKVGGGAGALAAARAIAARAVPIVAATAAAYAVGKWADRAAGFDSANGTMRQTATKDFGLQRSASGLAQAWGFLNRAGTADPNRRLNEFGDQIHNIGMGIRNLPTGKLLALRDEALKLADGTSGASKDEVAALKNFGAATDSILNGRVKQTLRETEGNFAGMRIETRAHLKDITTATRDNMATISQELGSKSAAGKEALAQNFLDASREVKKSMDAGLISAKTGMQEIDDLLSKRLQVYGFSKADAKRFVGYGDGPGHHATGGYVQSSTARGTDSVPIVVGAGESVNTVHQQREINKGLAIAHAATGGRYRWGHLDQIYSNVTSRHADATGYARGGYVFPFPKGENFSWARVDQGQDLQGPAGGPVVAIGPGNVTSAHDRFSGFGDSYPLLRLDAGKWAGRTVYYGHAHTTHTGPVTAGERIGVTQTKPNTWTAAPAGWLEFGFWPPGSMSAGRAVAPMLHAIAGNRVAGTGDVAGHGVYHPLAHILSRMPGALGGVVQGALNLDWAAANHAAKWAFTHGSSTGPVKGGVATLSQLEQAWSRYGPRRMEWIMGQIALAESGGRLNATNVNTNGTIDRGPWQANSSWGKWSTMSMGGLDRAAQAAAHIWHAQGLQAWTSDRAFEKYVRGKHATGPGQFAHGGYAWGGWHRDGADMTVHRPTIFGAGEAGPERVTIQPMATAAASHTGSGRGAVETWDHYLADVHLKKWIAELERLGVSGEAKRRAKVILDKLPPALAQETFSQLTSTHRALQTTIDAHHNVSRHLAAAKRTVAADQRTLAAERHAGASQATIDATSANLKAAQAQVKQLSGSDSRLSARQQRLTTALKAVEKAQGDMIDTAAKRAQALADHVNKIETSTSQRIRRMGIDASGSKALGMQTADSSREMRALRESRQVLDTQIKRAQRLGDKDRLATLRGQRSDVNASITEVRTQHIERARQQRLAAAQEGVDNAGFFGGMAQSALAAYDIAHRHDASTAAGMRGRAAAIASTTPALANQIAAYSHQADVAKQTGDLATWKQAMQAATDATNQLAQAQADAADLITQAARQQAQDTVDNSQFGIDTAQGGLQGLQISQQLMGTAGTTGGNQQLADYIANTIIPAMQAKLTADQAKLAELQAEPNPDLQAIHQTLLDIQGDTNQIGQAQVDKLNDIKDNTEPLKDFGGSSAFDLNGQTETDPGWGTGA